MTSNRKATGQLCRGILTSRRLTIDSTSTSSNMQGRQCHGTGNYEPSAAEQVEECEETHDGYRICLTSARIPPATNEATLLRAGGCQHCLFISSLVNRPTIPRTLVQLRTTLMACGGKRSKTTLLDAVDMLIRQRRKKQS